ncbi:MAG: TonB family protein [Rhizomicrobium sp.]
MKNLWLVPLFMAVFAAPASATWQGDVDAKAQPAVIGAPHSCQGLYPPDAVEEIREGDTTVGFTITAQGTVTDATVVKSSGHADLDTAALICVRNWQYRPAVANGEPVAVHWKVLLKWIATPPSSPLDAATRPLRRDVWNCLKGSPAVATLPAQFTALFQIRIRFSTWLSGPEVTVSQSSGSSVLDAAAAECVRQSRYLAGVDKAGDKAAGVSFSIAWWRS